MGGRGREEMLFIMYTQPGERVYMVAASLEKKRGENTPIAIYIKQHVMHKNSRNFLPVP